jgi:hypothetical protein
VLASTDNFRSGARLGAGGTGMDPAVRAERVGATRLGRSMLVSHFPGGPGFTLPSGIVMRETAAARLLTPSLR